MTTDSERSLKSLRELRSKANNAASKPDPSVYEAMKIAGVGTVPDMVAIHRLARMVVDAWRQLGHLDLDGPSEADPFRDEK
jgi:hypothetical protein